MQSTKAWTYLCGALLASAPAALMAQTGTAPPAAEKGIAALLKETPVSDLQAAMAAGTLSSEELTRGSLAIIATKNKKLHAVISVNPDAVADAKQSDEARKAGKNLGPLMGIPVLLKDNIETKDKMATTAGSLALKDNITHRDAPLAARLRAAGAIIVGKANLSEWANIRSTHSVSGWSGIGGRAANPYDPARSTCGSSAGSGAAVAADMVVLAVGTETDGSVTCPASANGLVGLKPTVGLISRTHVVPISHTQDTAGPMTHTVQDAALMLNAMAGSDPEDIATKDADSHKVDYAAGLSKDGLKGVRIGILRDTLGSLPKLKPVFDAALARLTKAGAILVDISDSHIDGLGDAEHLVLMTELKVDLNAYLASTAPDKVKTRTLTDLIAFDDSHAATEMPWFGQELFLEAETTKGYDDPDYIAAHEKSTTGVQQRLDGLLKDNQVTILITPSRGPAWYADLVNGDMATGGPTGGRLPATAGYPHLTVPMGMIQGLPVGLSFIGTKWSEAELLKAGYAFEQAGPALTKPAGSRP